MGGIAGQAEPHIELQLSADRVGTLRGEVDRLRQASSSFSDAVAQLGETIGETDPALREIESGVYALGETVGAAGPDAENAVAKINAGLDALTAAAVGKAEEAYLKYAGDVADEEGNVLHKAGDMKAPEDLGPEDREQLLACVDALAGLFPPPGADGVSPARAGFRLIASGTSGLRQALGPLKASLSDLQNAMSHVSDALASETTRNGGRPAFLLEGEYSGTDRFSAFPADDSGESLTQRTLLFRRTLMERWELSASGGFGENARTLRYLSPSGSSVGLELWGKENGIWKKLETEAFGSYLRFTVPAGVRVLTVTYYTPLGWLWVILGALASARRSWPFSRWVWTATRRPAGCCTLTQGRTPFRWSCPSAPGPGSAHGASTRRCTV